MPVVDLETDTNSNSVVTPEIDQSYVERIREAKNNSVLSR